MRIGFTQTCVSGLCLLVMLGLCATNALAQRATGVNRTTGTARTGTGGGAARSGEYPKSTQIGEAMITSNPETRQIIIVTDEDTNVQIGNVVSSLDKPKPQVLIKVVFLQVAHGNDLDLGVEGAYTHQAGDRDATASTSFGLENAAAIAAGGGVYKIVSDDLTLLIRALAVAGKTEILSRPSILARNSQLATIVVGQEVPFVTNSRTDNNGNLINTVQYQDIGIILRVTPFISSDGMVEMILAPEISALSDKTVEIGSGLVAPVIDKRSADTVVVTPNGKTVAIGGLIGTTKTSQIRKVPILGDIPFLGLAFRRTITSDLKTELLIFLTPYVIMQPGDLVKMTEDERSKLIMAPNTFEEKELNRLLDGLPVKPPGAPPAPGTTPAPKKKN